MRRLSRRELMGWAGLATASAGIATFLWLGEPPSEQWVRDTLWGDDLLAYAVWDGAPRAVLAFGDGRVEYDLLIRGDWFWPTWPPRPQWQMSGRGYAIAASDAPATAGWAPCVGIMGERCGQPPELFGQINDPDIVAMEARIDGAWRRFAVAAPGFAVRLDGVTTPPSAYRWLDATGQIVWETVTASCTNPAGDCRERRRHRPQATPAA